MITMTILHERPLYFGCLILNVSLAPIKLNHLELDVQSLKIKLKELKHGKRN
jgi:hypothetical protein